MNIQQKAEAKYPFADNPKNRVHILVHNQRVERDRACYCEGASDMQQEMMGFAEWVGKERYIKSPEGSWFTQGFYKAIAPSTSALFTMYQEELKSKI